MSGGNARKRQFVRLRQWRASAHTHFLRASPKVHCRICVQPQQNGQRRLSRSGFMPQSQHWIMHWMTRAEIGRFVCLYQWKAEKKLIFCRNYWQRLLARAERKYAPAIGKHYNAGKIMVSVLCRS